MHPKGCWHYPGKECDDNGNCGPGVVFSKAGKNKLTPWGDALVCLECTGKTSRRRRLLGMVEKSATMEWNALKQRIQQPGVGSKCKGFLDSVELDSNGKFVYQVTENNRIGVCIKHVFTSGKQQDFKANGILLRLLQPGKGAKVGYTLTVNGRSVKTSINGGKPRRRRLLSFRNGRC
jgi:hypothetical protein